MAMSTTSSPAARISLKVGFSDMSRRRRDEAGLTDDTSLLSTRYHSHILHRAHVGKQVGGRYLELELTVLRSLS